MGPSPHKSKSLPYFSRSCSRSNLQMLLSGSNFVEENLSMGGIWNQCQCSEHSRSSEVWRSFQIVTQKIIIKYIEDAMRIGPSPHESKTLPNFSKSCSRSRSGYSEMLLSGWNLVEVNLIMSGVWNKYQCCVQSRSSECKRSFQLSTQKMDYNMYWRCYDDGTFAIWKQHLVHFFKVMFKVKFRTLKNAPIRLKPGGGKPKYE